MRFAYADPPYPGQEHRYAITTGVNHRLLVAYLDEFDGWALSTSAPALREVWNLCPHARVASWVKTYASNGWSRVRWSWEPVLFVTPRKIERLRAALIDAADSVEDWGAYAAEYFQEKWDLKGDIAAIRAAAVEGREP